MRKGLQSATYRKHNIVCRELENMDEKSYVPLRDVFHMIENVRDDTHSPKHFLELASMYPEEYLVYKFLKYES